MTSQPRTSAPAASPEKAKVSKRSQAAAETALQIERFYSHQILTGKLPPGSRLPPNSQLTQIWTTSNATVQRALSKLTSEGLVERQQGRGTFVRDKAEQSLIGVFVGPNLAKDVVGFHRSLVAKIRELIETEYVSLRVYDGLTMPTKERALPNGSGGNATRFKKSNAAQAVRSFALDSRYHAFNGYIYLATSNISAHEAMDDLSPRVSLHDEHRGDDVILDSVAFLEEALTELRARGAKKIAYMQAYWRRAPKSADLLTPALVRSTAKCLGVSEVEFWDFPLTTGFDEIEADAVLRAGFLDEKIRRGMPDAVIISDDVIARPMIFNLVRKGFRIPTDVMVCVRSNDAQRLYYGEPVFRYELPVGEISQALVDLLRLRMSNQPEPSLPIRIKGRFREQ